MLKLVFTKFCKNCINTIVNIKIPYPYIPLFELDSAEVSIIFETFVHLNTDLIKQKTLKRLYEIINHTRNNQLSSDAMNKSCESTLRLNTMQTILLLQIRSSSRNFLK